jgi:hypothetical protein
MKNIILITLSFLSCLASAATTLNVGAGKTYSNPATAAAVAKPGDTILIHPGNYQGPYFISDLHGKANAWIVVMGVNKSTVIMQSGSEGLHFSDITFVRIQGLTFTGQTGNGMNIDDAGTMETPARNIVISNCDFRYMGAQGNNDFLKLSGIDTFEVSNCNFMKAAAGGSGIDMVGCHYGRIHHCTFDSMGSNSIQMKGGSQYLNIINNSFINGGQRALNIGGSTGLSFFRPIDAKFEAADISVYANVFVKSMAPIAFVGCENVDVANNTIYTPEKWVIRILQETVDTTRFVPCRNALFRNNIVYFTGVVTTAVNIGANTLPNTFLFSHNLWYNSSSPSSSAPQLPTFEISSITGQDPRFVSGTDFNLQQSSPAIGNGTAVSWLPRDMNDRVFKNPPSRGAFEVGGGSGIRTVTGAGGFVIYPNPATDFVTVAGLQTGVQCSIVNSLGEIVATQSLDPLDPMLIIDFLPAGLYRLMLNYPDGNCKSQFLIKF